MAYNEAGASKPMCISVSVDDAIKPQASKALAVMGLSMFDRT